jgi:hypothetical protein
MAATLQLEGRSKIRVIDVENQGKGKYREQKGRKIKKGRWKHEQKSESK